MSLCGTTRIMKKYFKRLPKENEGWESKSTSKNDNMEKTKDGEDTEKIKKSSSEYRAEKITGFTNKSVHEKIKNQWECIHLKVTGVSLIMFMSKQPL